jgi:hypothetical protein
MNAPAKTTALFEPRPLYGIGTVARLTSLKPDTLRVWERRYGLGASYKSPSGRRQYTQSDLEHLQLIAALVHDGARIGEIARAERKTLELLIKGRGKHLAKQLPPSKPKVLFIGAELCGWLDEHQGCIASVSALLVRQSLTDVLDTLSADDEIAMLVVGCGSLSTTHINAVEALAKRLGSPQVLVVYRLANDRWLEELGRRGASALEFPLEPARFAYEMGRVAVEADARQGEFNLGELVKPKPRSYDDKELAAAGDLKRLLNCECPRHIVDLIKALNEFEQYGTECSVENWQDAAVHACIYTYTNQARYLMEKALKAVIEERGGEFQTLFNERKGS